MTNQLLLERLDADSLTRFSMHTYFEWNRLLVNEFFNRTKHSRSVRLSVDEETLAGLGGNKDDLALAALLEAESQECTNIQELGLVLCRRWLESLRGGVDDYADHPPPFVGVLALYVLAVNHGGAKWPAHTYYDRLHDLLAEPENRIGTLEPSLSLWKELERWSRQLLGGCLGVFRVAIVGEQAHVGIPKRQLLLSTRERPALERAFLRAGLTPGSDPSDRQLHFAVRGADGLLTRTHRLLSGWPTDEAARDLLTEIRNQVENWDVSQLTEVEGSSQLKLPLRLVLRTHGSQITEALFVTDLVAGVTDKNRRLCVSEGPDRYADSTFETLAESSESSRPIIVNATHDPGWAAYVSWLVPISFDIEGSTATISRPRNPYLILGRGDQVDMLEEVEPGEVRPGERYLFMTSSPSSASFPSFVGDLEGEWRPSRVQDGMFFRRFIGRAQAGDEEWQPNIRLVGGIPTERGKGAYLSFALPVVVVENPTPGQPLDVRVKANHESGLTGGGSLQQCRSYTRNSESVWGDAHSATLEFGLDLPPTCIHCQIEVVRDATVVASRGFYVDHEPLSEDLEAPAARNDLGLIADREEDAVIRGLTLLKPPSISREELPIGLRLLQTVEHVERDVAGIRLMHLMRARKRLAWTTAKRILPGCLPPRTSVHSSARYLVHQMRLLHSLGVIELEENPEGGISSLVALPKQLVLLPRKANRGYDRRFGDDGTWASLQAVLAGCWLEGELHELKIAARKCGVELHVRPRSKAEPFIPHSRSLLATGERALERLSRLADSLSIELLDYPLACGLANTLCDIDQLERLVHWTPGQPADTFQTRFFDPWNLGVSDRQHPTEDGYSLWECRYPDRAVWRFFIVDAERGRRLEVPDRQLARWFLRLKALPDVPVPSQQDDVLIPLELRLPPLLERMLVLSSGRSPEFKRYEVDQRSPFERRDVSRLFHIPAPPASPVDWLGFRDTCTGNFCLYRGCYGTAAWRRGEPLPMLGVRAEQVSYLGLEDVPL